MSDIKTTFSSRSMASSPSLWPTITCSELSCSRTTRYLPASLPPCSTYFHQKSLLWRSRILSCLVNPLTTKPFLDIRVVLNQNTLINLEMQVINEHNWPERSLSYLCREFDQLSAGQSYESVKPAIQIGLLNFTLFPDHPEFYATYKLLNVKNHTVYSDKLQLSVLDLTQIHLATDEDKACHIDFWASLFKARTWEELHMLSQNNEYLKEASETVYHLTQEEKVRLQCQAREDYYRRMKGIQEKFEQLKQYKAEIKQYEAQKVQYEAQKVQYEAEKKQFEAQKAQFAAEKIQSDAEIAELKQQIAALKKELEAKSRE